MRNISNALWVLFCAVGILVYLYQAEKEPQNLRFRDYLMMFWMCLKMVEVILEWF